MDMLGSIAAGIAVGAAVAIGYTMGRARHIRINIHRGFR